MSRSQEQSSGDIELADGELDYEKITPYDVIRMQNCKTARFLNREAYPSIRPPVSKCSKEQTKTWLADAVEEIGCARPFGTGKEDDILEAWKQSPNKHTLSCYGLGSDIYLPDAIVFNQTLIKSLNKVNNVEPESKKSKKPKQSKKTPKPKGAYVLNRSLLQCTINQMPTVMKKTNASSANSVWFCPNDTDNEYPFLETEPIIPLQRALDMEKPVRKPKHGLRRKHMYCNLQCGIPENKCTEYEWAKYKQDPLPYETALQFEVPEMNTQTAREPSNFDELYATLVSCFDKSDYEIPECEIYGECCRRRSERKSIQGCSKNGPLDCNCEETVDQPAN